MDYYTLVLLYVAVVQAFLLYEVEPRVFSPHNGRTLGGYHHRVFFSLSGRHPSSRTDVTWVYPPLEEAMAEAVIHEVDIHVTHL